VSTCEAGRVGFILRRIVLKTLKVVSAASLTKRSALKSCAEDEEKNHWVKRQGKYLTQSWR